MARLLPSRLVRLRIPLLAYGRAIEASQTDEWGQGLGPVWSCRKPQVQTRKPRLFQVEAGQPRGL